jgi:hypothetical protein
LEGYFSSFQSQVMTRWAFLPLLFERFIITSAKPDKQEQQGSSRHEKRKNHQHKKFHDRSSSFLWVALHVSGIKEKQPH